MVAAHQPPRTATLAVSRGCASAPGRCAARPRVSGASAMPGRCSRRARAPCAPSCQALEARASGRRHASGPDLRALLDGSANVALRFGDARWARDVRAAPAPGGQPGRAAARRAGRPPRAQPAAHPLVARRTSPSPTSPPRWRSARRPPRRCRWRASSAPPPRSEWARDAATLQRALGAVQPVLLPDAQVVLVLSDRRAGGPRGRRHRRRRGRPPLRRRRPRPAGERGLRGSVVFAPPRSTSAQPGATSPSSRRPIGAAPFQISAVEAAIADIAVAVLQLRGEPTRFDRILGEVLLGLDHLGHLRRLVGTPRPSERRRGVAAGASAPGFFGVVSDLPSAPGDARACGRRGPAGGEVERADGDSPARVRGERRWLALDALLRRRAGGVPGSDGGDAPAPTRSASRSSSSAGRCAAPTTLASSRSRRSSGGCATLATSRPPRRPSRSASNGASSACCRRAAGSAGPPSTSASAVSSADPRRPDAELVEACLASYRSAEPVDRRAHPHRRVAAASATPSTARWWAC